MYNHRAQNANQLGILMSFLLHNFVQKRKPETRYVSNCISKNSDFTPTLRTEPFSIAPLLGLSSERILLHEPSFMRRPLQEPSSVRGFPPTPFLSQGLPPRCASGETLPCSSNGSTLSNQDLFPLSSRAPHSM